MYNRRSFKASIEPNGNEVNGYYHYNYNNGYSNKSQRLKTEPTYDPYNPEQNYPPRNGTKEGPRQRMYTEVNNSNNYSSNGLNKNANDVINGRNNDNYSSFDHFNAKYKDSLDKIDAEKSSKVLPVNNYGKNFGPTNGN